MKKGVSYLQESRNLTELQILKILYDAGKKMSPSEVAEQLREKYAYDEDVHPVSVRRIMDRMTNKEYLKSEAISGWMYYSLADNALTRLGLGKEREPYVENEVYNELSCPEMPVIEEVLCVGLHIIF